MRKSKEYHGDTKTDLYQRWSSMINRCKKGSFSKNYFDKGIIVCEEWKEYGAFKVWALENGFKKELELDRKENDKGYYPANCHFVTKLVNTSNRSNTIFVNYNSERISLTLFAEKNKLPKNVYNTIRRRIKNGWDDKKAIETPIKNGNYGHVGTIKVIDTISSEIYQSIKEASLSIGIRPNNLSMMLSGKRTNTSNLKKL